MFVIGESLVLLRGPCGAGWRNIYWGCGSVRIPQQVLWKICQGCWEVVLPKQNID